VSHATQSGKPEACIRNAKPPLVSADLASLLLDHGYSISQQTDTMVRGDRPVDNVAAAVLLGSRYDSTPNARITYSIVKRADCVRVVADIMIVTNPGSAYERLTPMNNSADSLKIQDTLDAIRQKYDPTPPAAEIDNNAQAEALKH